MRFILIGNFHSDKQESMSRFAKMLDSGFREAGYMSEIWYPKAYFSVISKSTLFGVGKWLGYIDKWIIFPLVLQWRLLHKDLNNHLVKFHICDHSNAIYLKFLPAERTSITCHDVLAIRGAMGYKDAHCPATTTGKILQKLILKNLKKAKRIAAVSLFTLTQLRELSKEQTIDQVDWRVIHNAFNDDFGYIPEEKSLALLNKVGLAVNKPFILHVGSNLPRKNRKLLIDMVAALGSQWQGQICYAGQGADSALLNYADYLGLRNRIISIQKPDHVLLVTLYSVCEAFIFPSYSEGFGWPIIEAQACGTPIIASNIEPLPEVSGGAALHADPNNFQSFASAFLILRNKEIRQELVKQGLVNCKRFDLKKMVEAYLELHKKNSTFN